MALSYDPLGRLQQTVAGAATTQFLYDGDRLSAEYNGATLLRRYVHGAGVDEPLVLYEGGANLNDKRYLIADHQGTIIAEDGATTARYTYGPYGEPNAWTGARLRYTGQAALPEVRLYHYKARVYDPVLGRFLQTDPVGYEDQMNLYAYVYNDPLNNTDPTGECGPLTLVCAGAGGGCAVTGPGCPVGAVVGAVLGGIATAGVIIGGYIFLNENADAPEGVPPGVNPDGSYTTPEGNTVRDHGRGGNGLDYLTGKGHSGESVDGILNDPADSYPTATGDNSTGGREGATAVIGQDGNWVVVNDQTGQVIQANDVNNPRQQPPRPREEEQR